MVDEALKVGAIPQFHGDEPAEACEAFAAGPYLKAYRLRDGGMTTSDDFDAYARPFTHATWLFDSSDPNGRRGGTGVTLDWKRVRSVAGARRVVIAGGLTPDNVADCVRTARPYAVDVRSGVESGGVKDARKMHAFVRAVREADAEVPV
jgi:phosphoribosylanthranilate isomerase